MIGRSEKQEKQKKGGNESPPSEKGITSHSSQCILERRTAVGLLVAILHDHRRIKRKPPFFGFALVDRARAGNDDRIFGHNQWLVSCGTVDNALYQIIQRCGARKDRA